MKVQVDSNDPTPLYAQLDRSIRVAIATARLKPGDQLPTVRQMAVDLRINANTVAKVYLTLERDGVLETKRGVGTFIATAAAPAALHDSQREKRLKELVERFLADASSLGFSSREAARYIARLLKEGD